MGNGTVAAPSLSFTSDADNGIYRIGANNIGVAAAGAKVLDVATTGLGVTGVLTTTGNFTVGSSTFSVTATNGNTTVGGTLGVAGLLSPAAAINNSAGTVGAPAYSFTGQTDMGFYKITSTQLGTSVSGTLVGGWNASGLFTSTITEQLTGSGITFAKQTIQLRTAATYTVDSTITAASLAKGLLVISSGTVTLTLPTATNIGTQLGATAGTTFDFVLQNSGTAGTATIAVNTGVVASGFPATNTLTLANSATIGIATFRLTFISATEATLTRIS